MIGTYRWCIVNGDGETVRPWRGQVVSHRGDALGLLDMELVHQFVKNTWELEVHAWEAYYKHMIVEQARITRELEDSETRIQQLYENENPDSETGTEDARKGNQLATRHQATTGESSG